MSPLALSLRFLQTQPDGKLVELARDGHERAFEALVRRYRGPLLAYCRRVAPRGTSPEDILQQGLLQAWRALGAGAEVRDPRAWLYRIVHNVAITALRTSGELPHGILGDPRAPAADQVLEQRMAARDALAGLAALPELQRQVMVSTALDGDTHEEIAAALGLTSGSVRGLIYRARSTLRAAAAALVPAPVIDWAVGDGGSGSAGLAGSAGSAGVGALLVKGGAIVAVGAIAGTTAIVVSHHTQRAVHVRAAQTAVRSNTGAGGSARADQTGQTSGARVVVASTIGPAGAARSGRGAAGSRTPGRSEGQRGGRFGGDGNSSSTGRRDGGAGTAFGQTGGGGQGDGSTGSDDGGSRPGRTGSSGADGSSSSSGSSGATAGGDGSGDRVDGGEQHAQGSGSVGGGDSGGSSGGGIPTGVHQDGSSGGSSHGDGPGDGSGSSAGSGALPAPTITPSPDG